MSNADTPPDSTSRDPEIRRVLIFSLLGFAFLGVVAYSVVIYPQMVRRAEQARREQLKQNLKQIGEAMHKQQQAEQARATPTASEEEAPPDR